MDETPRPPGLEEVAQDGLKLAARVATGLLALPLVGLALLVARKAGPEVPAPAEENCEAGPAAEPFPASASTPVEPAEPVGLAGEQTGGALPEPPVIPSLHRPSSAEPELAEAGDPTGPRRADVEAALQKLTHATISASPPRRPRARTRKA